MITPSGSGKLKESRTVAHIAKNNKMNRVVILIAFISLLAYGCQSTKVTSVATHEKAVSYNQDSCYDHETVTMDSIVIPLDSVSTFLPIGWITDTLGYTDPAPIYQKQGRATLKIERRQGGIQVTASCDSLLQVLISRNHEIFRLRNSIDSTMSSRVESSKEVKVIPKTPARMIILLIISLAINVILVGYKVFNIVYKIKTRLL
jgi:hypothetical protein